MHGRTGGPIVHVAQVENERSQNRLFEVMSKRDEQESARQQDADQAAADFEEAHKKLRYACY